MPTTDALELKAENERLRGLLRECAPAVQSYRRKHEKAFNGALRRMLTGLAENHAETMGKCDRILAAIGSLGAPTVQPNAATQSCVHCASERISQLTFGVEFLHLWMRTPNPMLGNVSPLDMMDSGRGERLADFIRQAAEADGITDPTERCHHGKTTDEDCDDCDRELNPIIDAMVAAVHPATAFTDSEQAGKMNTDPTPDGPGEEDGPWAAGWEGRKP